MLAFALSGAGNRGPLEVGALQALLEAGKIPDIIVGTSAGAINAAYLAAHGASLETVTQMGTLWRNVTSNVIYPENLLQVGWRLMTKADSLYSSGRMRQLLADAMPSGVTTFGDLKIPLFVTATDLTAHDLYIFGNNPKADLVDAVLASASVPGIHPPVKYESLQLVDGGVLANVPASIAMEQGADTIYALNVTYGGGRVAPAAGVLDVLGLTLSTLLGQALLQDIDRAEDDPKVDLYHIHLPDLGNVSFRDFSQTDAMIKAGYERTKAFLAAPPAPHAPALGATVAPIYGKDVGRAQQYIPPFLR